MLRAMKKALLLAAAPLLLLSLAAYAPQDPVRPLMPDTEKTAELSLVNGDKVVGLVMISNPRYVLISGPSGEGVYGDLSPSIFVRTDHIVTVRYFRLD